MAKKTVITNNGTKGGNLVGKPHNDKKGNDVGGIKAIVTDANNRPVELEGGEVIINKEASKKHWKELSRINQSAGNGVPIEKPIDPHDEDPQEFAKGGKIQFNPNQLPNKWILKYAQHIKKNYPEIWKKGGNIYGNQAFINLERVVERGYWLDSEEWMYIKWRSYVARHKGDFRIEGVVAMLKWVDKVDKGWQYMKNLIEDEIKKLKQKKSSMAKGGWSVSKNQRMSKGGSVENKSFVVFFKSNVLNNIVYTNIDSDSLENAIKTQKSAYDWSDIQWIKGFEQKDANYLQEFFLHNIKQKWETNSELSVHIKDDKILFKRNTDTVEFEFTPLFEIKENQRVFKEAYLSNENAEIYIDSDFNFDRNKIFELIFNKMSKGGKTMENTEKLIQTLKQNSNVQYGIISTTKDGEKYRYVSYRYKNSISPNWLVMLYQKAAAENGNWFDTKIFYKDYTIHYDRPTMKNMPNGSMGMKELEIIESKKLKMAKGGQIETPMTVDEMENFFYRRNAKVSVDEMPKYITDGAITYQKIGYKKTNGLKQGMFIVATYKKYNVGAEFFRIEGFIKERTSKNPTYKEDLNNEKEILENIIERYDTMKEMLFSNGCSKLEELETLEERSRKLNVDFQFSILFRDVTDNGLDKLGNYYFIYDGKWSRGSGAEPLSFIQYIPLAGDVEMSMGNVQRQDPLTHEKITEIEHIPSMSSKGVSSGFSVGDKGWYNGKKRVPIEITKLNEKNVYFLNTETGEVKRSETKNFERLFEKELNVQEREKFIEEANVEVESWQENNEREEKLSKKPKKSNKEEAQTAISSKEKPDYYALFKQKFSVMEYTNNEVVGVQLTAFTEIAKENKLLKVQDITDLLTAIQKLA